MLSPNRSDNIAQTALQLCCGKHVIPANDADLTSGSTELETERAGVFRDNRRRTENAWTAQHRTRHAKTLTYSQLTDFGNHQRRLGRQIVFTNGCFDLLHFGHVTSLTEAATMGDLLVVGINSDASVRRLKGPTRPIVPQVERVALLKCLECVTAIVIFDESTPCRLLETLRPDVLVKGGTYAPNEVVGSKIVESYGGTVRITQIVDGISTTQIVESLKQRYQGHGAFRSSIVNSRRS